MKKKETESRKDVTEMMRVFIYAFYIDRIEERMNWQAESQIDMLRAIRNSKV